MKYLATKIEPNLDRDKLSRLRLERLIDIKYLADKIIELTERDAEVNRTVYGNLTEEQLYVRIRDYPDFLGRHKNVVEEYLKDLITPLQRSPAAGRFYAHKLAQMFFEKVNSHIKPNFRETPSNVFNEVARSMSMSRGLENGLRGVAIPYITEVTNETRIIWDYILSLNYIRSIRNRELVGRVIQEKMEALDRSEVEPVRADRDGSFAESVSSSRENSSSTSLIL